LPSAFVKANDQRAAGNRLRLPVLLGRNLDSPKTSEDFGLVMAGWLVIFGGEG